VARAPELPSRAAINRAGRLLADRLEAYRERGAAALDEFDANEVAAAEALVDRWRDAHRDPLGATNANLRHYVRHQPEARVSQRLKKHETILDKLIRLPTMELTRMEDIGGCRVLLPDQADVIDLARRLKKNWTIVRHRDYVAEPKPDGYRAHHLVAEKLGRRIEVQLRTPLQDLWANTVEEHGRRLAFALKSGKGPDDLLEYYREVSELLALEERGESPDDALLARLRLAAESVKPYLVDEDALS